MAFEIVAAAGWVADRNEAAMHGARALGRHFAAATGARLHEIGEPGPAAHRPWADVLEHAQPQLRALAAATASLRSPALVVVNRCAASIATIAGALRANPALAVLYLDAQADFNTPASTMS